jgi:hypothetical protein
MSSSPHKPTRRKTAPQKLWTETDPDGLRASIGIKGSFCLHARYDKGTLEIETTDGSTAVEVEPWSSDIRIVFKKRPASRRLPMSD